MGRPHRRRKKRKSERRELRLVARIHPELQRQFSIGLGVVGLLLILALAGASEEVLVMLGIIAALDKQEGGNHYKDMKIQPVEFIDGNKIPFLEGNIIKYICRHANKSGAEDVRKVIHYAELILELRYGEKRG